MKSNQFNRKGLFYFIVLFFFISLLCSCGGSRKVMVYRDEWGIPHIYADSEVAAVFAFGYVQAEDRLEQILRSYRYAEGTLAEAFGERYVDTDSIQRVWRHAKVSREKFAQLPAKIQQMAIAFIGGIKRYMEEHPERVPAWAPEIYPWHVVAWGRTYIWSWPLGQALADLRRGTRNPRAPRNSNQWVVAPQRTTLGAPIALIDPHLSFRTTGHWYEARIHAGNLQVCGICVPGTPFVALGHNQHISWAATTGGPDCADVYELEINPDDPLQYRYDGEWRPIIQDTITIRVRTGHGRKNILKVVERCQYGPIALRRGNKAYALRLAYENEYRLAEEMLAINKARNLTEFKKALAMGQLMPQNIMFASTDGDIYYARTGRVPIRPPGVQWDRPVPGNTSASDWQGIHPHGDLVQIENPNTGFMQNCNISPGTMMPESPLTPEKYPPYIYNDSGTRTNPRGRMAVNLLQAEERLSLERAKQIALDTRVEGYEHWLDALKKAFAANRKFYPVLQEPVALLLGWKGHLDKDDPAAPLFRFWLRECARKKIWSADPIPGQGKTTVNSRQKQLCEALRKARTYLINQFGTFQIPWGKTVRLQRGGKSWGVSGGSFDNGVTVLRAVWGSLNEKTGLTTVTGGQSGCMLVVLTEPIQSFSILPWGESDDPESPHYVDQAEKLFSQSRFKSTYFSREELLKHLESETEITVPADVLAGH